MFLPVEILNTIFGNFAQQSIGGETGIQNDCISRKTLASLCRSSKGFNVIATPLLYHHVRLFNGDIRLFAGTILQDLNTRRLIKKLSLEFELPGTQNPDEVDWERRREVPSMVMDQWDYELCLSKVLSLLGTESTFAGVGGVNILIPNATRELDFSNTPEEDLAAVLLFVLPELRYLQVKFDPMSDYEDPESVGYWRCDMLLQTLRLPHFVRSQQPSHVNRDAQDSIPASLLRLEELILCNPFEEAGTIKASYPPILFCSLYYLQPFWGLPNLRALTLERASWDKPPPLIKSSLEHLELLDTAVKPSELPLLLQHFPSLRSIKYALARPFDLTDPADGFEHFSREMLNPVRIEEIIRSCKLNLEEIIIEAHNPSEIDLESMADWSDGSDEV